MKTGGKIWLWLATVCIASQLTAQEATRQTGWLVDYVAPSLIATPETKVLAAVPSTNGTAMVWELVRKPADTPTERRFQFEVEFGIREPEPGRVRGAIRQAKYRLDETIFEATEWLESVERTLEWQYEFRRRSNGELTSRRQAAPWSSNPLRDMVENATVRADVDLKLSGRAFVGLRLELPIGP